MPIQIPLLVPVITMVLHNMAAETTLHQLKLLQMLDLRRIKHLNLRRRLQDPATRQEVLKATDRSDLHRQHPQRQSLHNNSPRRLVFTLPVCLICPTCRRIQMQILNLRR